MCIAARLNSQFCREARKLIEDVPLAICPSTGVDMVAVVRHAMAASRTWSALDDALAAARIAVVSAAGGLVLALVVATASLGTGVNPFLLIILPLAVLLGAGAAAAFAWTRTRTAVRGIVYQAAGILQGRGGPRDLADSLEAEQENRLNDLNHANLIVFSLLGGITDSDGMAMPFVGAGKKINRFIMEPVDISRGRHTADGTRLTPKPFSVSDLCDYFILNTESLGLSGVRVTKKLYIRGDSIYRCDGIWGDKGRRPPCRVHEDWVNEGLNHPTDQARTYLVLEQDFNGGLLVVSTFVRPHLSANLLTLEIASYVLPGIDPAHAELTEPFNEFFTSDMQPVHGDSFEGAADALTRRLLRDCLRVRNDRPGGGTRSDPPPIVMVERAHSPLPNLYFRDFGATTSLREQVARRDVDGYFEVIDAIDCLGRMTRGVADCLQKFLRQCDIDEAEYGSAVQTINNYTHNIIGKVQGDRNLFGSGSRMADGRPDGRPKGREPAQGDPADRPGEDA